jgi:preflagellin peptidase FlaK
MVLGVASVPDLLRLVFLPVFAWAAYRDIRTRRLPNALWPPLALLGVFTLAWDAVVRFPFAGYDDRVFLIRVGFAVLFLIPFSYAAYFLRAFGGADAKAMMVLALAFPITPSYALPESLLAALPASVVTALPRLSLPLYPSVLGVAAMSALTNAVLVALAYVLLLGLRNALSGRFSLAMFIGRPRAVEDLPEAHGTLLATDGTLPSTGLDLDALRMYLRWRGCTLADLRADPIRFRDSGHVGETFDPTDGAVHRGSDTVETATATHDHEAQKSETESNESRDNDDEPNVSQDNDDEWEGTGFVSARTRQAEDEDESSSEAAISGEDENSGEAAVSGENADEETHQEHDPWAAAAFLDDIDGSAYGTTPEKLRDGLATVTREETVWVSPGLPFVVPLFGGLLVALTYGDVLTVLLRAVDFF